MPKLPLTITWIRELALEDASDRLVLPAATASALAREVAGTLAHRCSLGVLSYVLVSATTLGIGYAEGERLGRMVLCAVLLAVMVGVRFAAAIAFERLYPRNPDRWLWTFRAGVYASAVCWASIVIQQMNASGSSWPTWAVLMMSIGVSAGATTSLCPDPPLLKRLLLLQFAPLALWGLLRAEVYSLAITIVMIMYLAFILVQARHNSEIFWHYTRDRLALREAGRRREDLVNSIDGIVWEGDAERRRFTFVSVRAETLLGYPVSRWLADPSFWQDHIHPEDRERVLSYCAHETAAGRDYTVQYRMLAAAGHDVWLRDIVTAARDGAEISQAVLAGLRPVHLYQIELFPDERITARENPALL